MPAEAPKPSAMQAIDYSDHTVEIDTRGFFSAMSKLKAEMEEADEAADLTDLNPAPM